MREKMSIFVFQKPVPPRPMRPVPSALRIDHSTRLVIWARQAGAQYEKSSCVHAFGQATAWRPDSMTGCSAFFDHCKIYSSFTSSCRQLQGQRDTYTPRCCYSTQAQVRYRPIAYDSYFVLTMHSKILLSQHTSHSTSTVIGIRIFFIKSILQISCLTDAKK